MILHLLLFVSVVVVFHIVYYFQMDYFGLEVKAIAESVQMFGR